MGAKRASRSGGHTGAVGRIHSGWREITPLA
jgi:hypothetical protein